MIKIIDYGVGNAGSIKNMLLKLGGSVATAEIPAELSNAKLIILPGVGSFDAGMAHLRRRGFDHAVREIADQGNVFFLGICLGMQLLFDSSEEGVEPGLGLIPGRVVRFNFDRAGLKIPHMGWSKVRYVKRDGILDGVFEDARFYFAHSYHVVCSDEYVLGATTYGHDFPSVVAKGRVYGAQFHPEKSHRYGLALLKRLVDIASER